MWEFWLDRKVECILEGTGLNPGEGCSISFWVEKDWCIVEEMARYWMWEIWYCGGVRCRIEGYCGCSKDGESRINPGEGCVRYV